MICIYKQDNNNYTNNGDAVLIPTVCDLAMTINGAWQLKITHPYDPEERYKLITEGAIIRIELECIAELETVYQLFRVYQYTKGLQNIEAIAFPVAMESTYDAPIDNLVISGKTGAQAMAQLQTFTNKYTLSSDITAVASSSYNNTNINEAIAGGNDNSFIQVWGGEILYDNYKFKVKTRLGDDTAGDHRVMYGRNLTNIDYEKDDSGIITRISPISQDNIRLDGTGYVDSSHIYDYPVAHHKYETAPYTLVDTEATSPSQTATLTRQAVAAVSAQADTLSHSAWTTASGAGYQPEYIKSIKTEITEAVQNMALANVVSTSLYNLMKTTIANAMAWLGDLKQPKWEWMGSDQTGWKYGNATSYAKNMYVKIGKTWSYFGSDGNWQEPKDDSEEWDWHDVKNGTGKKYGNFNKYFAHNEYVYITQSGTIKEYWFNEQGWFEEDESGDSEYYWHGSGTGADPYWFGKDSSTYLKSCWRFIDGTYYFFDSYGYVAAQKDNYQWDWVESGDASRAWFGNAINSEYGSEGACLKSQWEKINGTWYYFDANGIVQSEAVSQTNAIAVFTTGMSGLTTTVDNWKGQLYSLLYSLMRSYCTWRYKQKIDLPAITIKVDMADLSKTEEYKDFADLEKIRLGDSVECIDYEHNISTTNRVIGITYDCILMSNKDITIGEASATVAQMVGNAQGEAVTGGFDTTAIENQLTALRNGKQDKLTAGDNITIIDNVISAAGQEGQGLRYFVETYDTLYGRSDVDIRHDPAFDFDHQVTVTFRAQGGTHTWSTPPHVTTGLIQSQVIRYLSANTWNGIFQVSDDPRDLSIYYKFVKDNWWDVDSEGTMTWDNCPNAMLYPCTSNVNAYGFKDTFEVDEKTYYIMTIGSNMIPFNTSIIDTYSPSTLYLPSYNGHAENPDRPDNGYYRTLGEFGDYLLSNSEDTYYNGLSRAGRLAFFAGGDDENGTNAPIKIYADGRTEGIVSKNESSDFVGATAITDGDNGLVPKPFINDKDKFLKGDGTWGQEALFGNTIDGLVPKTEGKYGADYLLSINGWRTDYNEVHLDNKLIGSAGGSYITTPLDSPMVEGDYKFILKDGNTIIVRYFTWSGSTVTLNIDNNYTMQVTETTAQLTWWRGSWRDIYGDIYRNTGASGGGGGITQQQADWTQTDSTAVDYIKNKPNLATVATSGSYADLSNKPSIPTKTSDLTNDSNFVSDANYVHTDNNFTTSEKTKLAGIESGAEANVQANWNETDNTSDAYIQNKPTLATVATTGDYDDLTDKPNLATVATSGDYDDLTNKPTIPAAQVNSDWNSSSGVSQILNKPTLATVATSGAYSDLSGTPSLATVATSGSYSDLSNKPTIPSVEANPSGTASATLSTLEVDGTIYNVPSGGGSDLPLTVENGKLCIIYET